jgi:hypothetical protein
MEKGKDCGCPQDHNDRSSKKTEHPVKGNHRKNKYPAGENEHKNDTAHSVHGDNGMSAREKT